VQYVLSRYLESLARGASHGSAVRLAAESIASDPWQVVTEAGLLARARPAVATSDLGLTPALRPVEPDDHRAIVRIDEGQPYPYLDVNERRRMGAFDTPRDLARRLARSTIGATDCARRALDPTCGAGAFLVAMAEAGVPEVAGGDIDPVAVEVARVACPRARVEVSDALEPGPEADIVCGNPPFVRSELQDPGLRAAMRARLPWLQGRFDLVVPFAALAAERVRSGGALGLVLPFSVFVQPYAAELRRLWLHTHGVRELSGPHPFGGAAVKVGTVVLRIGARTHAWPADDALRLPNAPLSPGLQPGDVEIVDRMLARSVPLGSLCEVDTGLVAHGRGGGKARLLVAAPTSETVPFADARDFFAGTNRWLLYRPAEMHRPKRPELFESDKLVIQRLRGDSPVRAAVDRSGIYVGHTCTVARPWGPGLDLDALVEIVRSPLVDGFIRIRCGARLDLYPRDVRSIPVPERWLVDPTVDLAEAFDLDSRAVDRLADVAAPQAGAWRRATKP